MLSVVAMYAMVGYRSNCLFVVQRIIEYLLSTFKDRALDGEWSIHLSLEKCVIQDTRQTERNTRNDFTHYPACW